LGEEWGNGDKASTSETGGEDLLGGESRGARVSSPGEATGGGDEGGGGGEPARGTSVVLIAAVVGWDEDFLRRLRRRGGVTTGEAGRSRSSASSKGSVSMAPRRVGLGFAGPASRAEQPRRWGGREVGWGGGFSHGEETREGAGEGSSWPSFRAGFFRFFPRFSVPASASFRARQQDRICGAAFILAQV
jgi:hypothetical protein